MTAAPRAILLAHGFTIEPMVGWLASALTERIVAGAWRFEVARVRAARKLQSE
jgi:hypothetical protein